MNLPRRNSRTVAGLLPSLSLLVLLACSAPPVEPPPPVPPPPGDHVVFGFGIYHLPRPQGDPDVTFRTLLNQRFKEIKLGPKTPGAQDVTFASIRRVALTGDSAPSRHDIAPPFGQELSAQQITSLPSSQVASLLKFEVSRQHLFRDLRSAYRLTAELARSAGGVILDLDTGEYFALDAWEGTRLAAWTEEVPNVEKLMVVRMSKEDDGARAVTRGMSKLDLPDLSVERFPTDRSKPIASLIDVLAQAQAEGVKADANGDLTLRLKDLRNASLRAQIHLLPNAKGEALLRLRPARRQEGDPVRLLEIGFDRYPGANLATKQIALLTDLFGTQVK